jgi:hypothetical protein
MSFLKHERFGAEWASNFLACNLWLYQFLPFLKWRHRVNRDTIKDDGIAGITGALIVLPQAVAFATIAGLPPEYGIYAAMVPTIIAALFGSSWHLVSGPTTAISIVVFASVSPYADPGTPEYIGMVLTLTFLTGLFQLIMGLAKMGALVNFISHTVVIGFTAGAALLIAASQVKNFFGLDIERGAPAYEVVRQLLIQIGDINPYIFSVAVVSLIAGLLARKYLKQIPYMIVAMVVGGMFAAILDDIFGNEVTGIKTVGALTASLPPLSMPDFSLATLKNTFFSASGGHRAGADRGGFHLALHRHQVGAAHQRQPGIHRPGPVQPARQFLLRLRLQRFLQPQRRQLRIRGAHAAGGGVLLAVPAADSVPGGAPGRPSADSGHGGGAVPGGLEPDRLPPHRRHPQGPPAGSRGAGRQLPRHGHRPGKGHLLRHRRLPDLLPARHVPPGHPLPGAGRKDRGNPRRKFVVETGAEPDCPQLKLLRIEGSIFFGAVDHIQHAFAAVDEHVPEPEAPAAVLQGHQYHRPGRRRNAGPGGPAPAQAGRRPLPVRRARRHLRHAEEGRLPGRHRRSQRVRPQARRHRRHLSAPGFGTLP